MWRQFKRNFRPNTYLLPTKTLEHLHLALVLMLWLVGAWKNSYHSINKAVLLAGFVPIHTHIYIFYVRQSFPQIFQSRVIEILRYMSLQCLQSQHSNSPKLVVWPKQTRLPNGFYAYGPRMHVLLLICTLTYTRTRTFSLCVGFDND